MLAEWRTIDTFSGQDGEVILTMHGDDLYPVCAFRIDGQWLRQTEGPEDVHGPGKWEPLYRAPTHWMPLPGETAPRAGGWVFSDAPKPGDADD